jgi:single-strand DNA-binding protein
MNLNKVFLIGRLTKNPELRMTTGGTSVATCGLATNHVFAGKDGKKNETVEYHNLVFWGKIAEILNQYSKKGDLLMVEGRIQTREWQAKDGSARSTKEIVVESMQFGPKPQGARAHEEAEAKAETINPEEVIGGGQGGDDFPA